MQYLWWLRSQLFIAVHYLSALWLSVYNNPTSSPSFPQSQASVMHSALSTLVREINSWTADWLSKTIVNIFQYWNIPCYISVVIIILNEVHWPANSWWCYSRVLTLKLSLSRLMGLNVVYRILSDQQYNQLVPPGSCSQVLQMFNNNGSFTH